jgi:hypothetical protein
MTLSLLPLRFTDPGLGQQGNDFDTKLPAQFVMVVGQNFQYVITLHAALPFRGP